MASDNKTLATSTAASGPAGSHFEGQIGAFYLLAMLSGAPPRGLPGTRIERVALQQANAGRPLDDVVIYASDAAGGKAVLEIQVKREITFTPSDPTFRKVVGQIVQALRHKDFFKIQYELAIATAKGSRKIDGAYQDVLMLARRMGDASTFLTQLGLAGAANDDMRTFVRTFRSHLQDEGAPGDDETTWQLLRRLQILTFDFTAIGSASEELARERAARVLHSEDISRSGALWANLIEISINVAKSGGDHTRQTLLTSLSESAFRFSGERRHEMARTALADASVHAISDIRNRIGSVVLARHELVSAVHNALDGGRYIEIRGDAGVGKSGILRQFAEQFSIEGQIVVLSPGRCVPRGWPAMRAQLGFNGSLRELLVELANDGGAALFVDNLDFFSDEERLTVVDLVNEASLVPGVVLITTCRHKVDFEEPSWLPSEAIERFGGTISIEIDGLRKAEIEQLKIAAPSLGAILSDGHPAHTVTQNLFRLARLAEQSSTDPVPRTEIDMAEQWWKSADGVVDRGWRERARLLQYAAEQTLRRALTIDVKGRPSEPIDALVAAGTLRNLGVDKVAFRHDVFREWAVANAVNEDFAQVDQLSLDRPVPAMLARGIELAARIAIERATNGDTWHALVIRLSREGSHPSWRRAAMLALVRSEASVVLLQRASHQLLENDANLLRELIRAVLAVEMVPATSYWTPALLKEAGIDPRVVPPHLTIPRGSTCLGLIVWLISIDGTVPASALAEVVQLYTSFSIGTFGLTELTAITTIHIYRWLRLLEPSDAIPLPAYTSSYWEHLEYEERKSLKTDLRNGFLMFCRRTPELATRYLKAVEASKHNDALVQNILRMRGTLAQAAPAALADFTAAKLIAKSSKHNRQFGYEREDPFTFLDSEFLPPSPTQGPFLELLSYAPKDGLAIVHKLVDHAISHGSRKSNPGANIITLHGASGARTFPWRQTYYWPRQSHYACVTSALMALEAWAHNRIEAGEEFETVLSDVLGPEGSPAAYLLVAVDLIISHWPKSIGVAAQFMACPELLCLDHARLAQDNLGLSELITGTLRREQRGASGAEKLTRRASRRAALEDLIGNYALIANSDERAALVSRLQLEAERLGPASADASLEDPTFMVLHALNLAEPKNWREFVVTRKDGSVQAGKRYVSPAAELAQLQSLRNAGGESLSDFEKESLLSLAVDNPSYLSAESRSAVVAWARAAAMKIGNEEQTDDDGGTRRMREEAIVIAAMIVMRDGDDALRMENSDWARSTLNEVLQLGDDDPVRQMRSGLRYNPTAIAFAGMIHALKERNTLQEIRALLEVVARGGHATAHGFGATISMLESIDERLPRALLRCAFSACILPSHGWDWDSINTATREGWRSQRATAMVEAEINWLEGAGPEPSWPVFPDQSTSRKRVRRISLQVACDVEEKAEQKMVELRFNYQAAALWLRQTRSLNSIAATNWLRRVVKCYMQWTLIANGVDHNPDLDDDVRSPTEWNHSFFELTARCMAGISFDEASAMALTPVTALPEKQFFDVLTEFQRSLDSQFFNEGRVHEAVAVEARTTIARRLMETNGWSRLKRSREFSIDRQIGPAIAVLFFNEHHVLQNTRCYILPKGVARTAPFLPLIGELVSSGPSPFVALVLLNFLEVAPGPQHLNVLVSAGNAWLEAYPDFRPFWVDHGFGRRWCGVVLSILQTTPAVLNSKSSLAPMLSSIVAKLIGLGIFEAKNLEDLLADY